MMDADPEDSSSSPSKSVPIGLLPMHFIEHKTSSNKPGEFARGLRILLEDHTSSGAPGSGRDANAYSAEIQQFEILRANACIKPALDINGVQTLKKYYCQLHFLKNRFQVKEGYFNFTWNDVYIGCILSYSDLDYELASVLYNIGAIHSLLGTRAPRKTSEGLKIACTHFQCAAWAFAQLPEKYPAQMSSDMGADLMTVTSQICLAQAQECILEKSIMDGRKSSIIAKVCAQVSTYYSGALAQCEQSNSKNDDEPISECLGDRACKQMMRYLDFKRTYYTAISYLFMGVQSEESQRMGERVAYFKAGSEWLDKCQKLGKLCDPKDKNGMLNALRLAGEVNKGKLEHALKENEFVFHEKIPDFDTLPALKGASLVKGIGFEITDPEVSGPDIFERIVPMEAHEAASMYSEEKAELLRSIGDVAENADSNLAIFLSSLQLEELPTCTLEEETGAAPPSKEQAASEIHLALVGLDSIPNRLIEAMASLDESVVGQLEGALERIEKISKEVEEEIKETKELMENESNEVSSFNALLGGGNGIPPSPEPSTGAITPEIELELKKFQDAHEMASESNQTLAKVIQANLDNLKVLMKPLEELKQQGLGEKKFAGCLDDEQIGKIVEFRLKLGSLSRLRAVRNDLVTSLRTSLHGDDITSKMVAYKDTDMKDIFEAELGKYKEQIAKIRENCSQQERLIRQVTDANADCFWARRVLSEVQAGRNAAVDSLVATAEETDDLRITAAKGLEFYDKLENNVHKLLLRVRGLVAVQQKQRDSQIAAYAPAAPTLASDLPPGFLEAPPSISGVENPAEDFEAAMAFHDQLQDEAPIPAQLATPTHQLASEIDPNFGTKEAIFSPEKQMSISSTTDPADQTALSQLQNRNGITLPSTFEDFDDDDEVMVMGPGMTFPVMASQVKPATKPEVAPEEQQVVKKDPPGPSESVSAPPSDKDVDEANKIAAESFTPVTSNEARLKENDDAKETVSELSEDNSLVQEASDSFKSPAHTTATAPPPGTPSSELPGGVSFYPGPSSMPSSSSYNPNPNPYMSQTAPYNPGHVAPPLAPTSYGVRPVPAVPASMPYPAVSTPYNPAMNTAMSQPYYGYQPTGQPLPNNQFHQQQYALPSNSFQYYQQPPAVTSSHPPPLKPEKLTLKAVLAQRKANKLPLPQDERKMSGGGSGYSSVEASPQHIPKSSGAAPVSSTPLPAPRVSTPPHLTMTTPAVQQPTLVGSDGHFHGHGSGQPAGQLPQAGPPRMSTQMQQPVVSQSPDKSQKEDDEDEGWTESKLIPVPRQRRDSDPVYVLSDEPSFPSQGSDESYGDYDPVRMYAEYAAIASKIPGNPIYQDEFRYQAKPHPASKNPTDAGAASPIPKSPAKPADNNQVEPPSVPSAQHQVHSTPVPQSPVPSQASGQPPQRHGTSMTPPNSFGHLNQAVPPTGSAGHQIPGPAGTHHVFPSPSKRVDSPSHALAPQSQVNPGYQQAVHLHHQSPRGPYPSGGNPSYLTQQANYSIRSANAQSAHVIPHSPQQQAPRHSAPTFQNPASHATSGYFPPQQVASQQVAQHQFASHQMAPQQVAHHQGASQTVPSLYQQQLTSVAYGFPTQHQPQAGHSSSTHTQYPTSSLTTPPNLSSQSSAYSAPAVRSLQTSTAAQGASPYPFQMQHGPAGGYNAASPTISHAYKVPVQQQQQLQQQQQQIQQPQQQPQQQQQQQHPTFTPAVSAGLQQQPHTPAPFYPSRSVVVNQNVGGVQWHQGQGQVHGQGQAAATYPPSSSAAALPLPPISSATMLGKSLLPPGQTQPVPSPPQDPLASRGINPSYAGSSSVGTMLPQQQAGAYPGSPNHARAPYPPRSTTVQPQVHHNPAPSPLRPQQQPNCGQTPSPSQYSAFPTIATSASYSMPEAATFPRQQPAPQAQQRQQQQPIHNAPSGQPVQHVSTHSADPSRNPVQTAGPLVGYKPVVPQPGGGGVLAGYYPDSLQPVVAQPGTTMVPGPSQMTAGVRPKEIGTTASQQATGAGGGYMLRPEAVPPGAPQGHVRRQSSVDILSELDQQTVRTPEVLQPKVLTASEVEEQQKEAEAVQEIANATGKDPYSDSRSQQQLLTEFRQLEEQVKRFSTDKTTLDSLWKELNTLLESDDPKLTAISVARCYPMKNRAPDVLPFDRTRVELPTTKDDYINASHIRDLGKHCPKFIATQAPTPSTLTDFWTMVWQEQTETLVCLLSDADLNAANCSYWPTDRKEPLRIGQTLEVTLQSVKTDSCAPWGTERIFTVMNRKENTSRVLILLQLNDYSLESLLHLVKKMLSYHRQQRVLTHPVLVHCLNGAGRTAQVLLLAAAVAEVNMGQFGGGPVVEGTSGDNSGLSSSQITPSLIKIAAQACRQRKGILREREHLRQCYQGLYLHCRAVLQIHGLIQPDKKALPQQQHHHHQGTGGSGAGLESLGPLLSGMVQTVRPEDQLGLVEGGPSSRKNSFNAGAMASQMMMAAAGGPTAGYPSNNPRGSSGGATFTSQDISRFGNLSLGESSAAESVAGGQQQRKREKFDKKDFTNPNRASGLDKAKQDASDPFSSLDPLWNMKQQ